MRERSWRSFFNALLGISDDMGIRLFNPFDLVDFRDHNIR